MDQHPDEDQLVIGARGGAIAFVLKISSTALGFINQIILARMLGAGGLGEVILAITVIRISSQIAKFGMEEAMMKFIPLYIDREDAAHLKGTIAFAIKFCFAVSMLFMLSVLAASEFISVNVFHSEGLRKLMPIAAIAIPAWVTRDIVAGIIKGHKDAFRAMIPESLISPLFRIVIFLILVVKNASPVYAIIAFVAGEIMSVTISIIFLQNKIKGLHPPQKLCEKKEILDVAYTIIFTGMSILLYTQADVWILGMLTSEETVGIYGIVAKVSLLVYFPMMAFSSLMFPIISSLYASGNPDEFEEVVTKSTRWILSMAMPIILILVLEGYYILQYVFGMEFSAGYPAMVILIAGQMIKAFSGLIAVVLMMAGEHKVYMKITILGGVLNVVLSILLVSQYGMIGAAAATAFCLSMVDVYGIYVVKKKLSILTLAKGYRFDILFIGAVASLYVMFHYHHFYLGQHILLLCSLGIYLWRSFRNDHIPWRLLIPQQK